MENKYEVVIIGSGLGGLSTAYILAKHGYKVAVFEKTLNLEDACNLLSVRELNLRRECIISAA